MAKYLKETDSYEVTILESKKRVIYIKAKDEKDAIEKVKKYYEEQMIRLNEMDIQPTKIY